MSLAAFNHEAKEFLCASRPEVLCVAGKWGVGKTYGWNGILKATRTSIPLKHYSYVSLFGLGSLDEVRRAIFENSVPSSSAGDIPDIASLGSTLKGLPTNWRKGGALARLFAPFGDYSAIFEKIGYFLVREQVVCIDDLERKSSSLDMRDMLGLISQLKDQKACKVVVLLNDEQLGDDGEEFRLQLEKVADTAVRFEPTATEAAEIGVDTSLPFHQDLRSAVIALGITNIRTIKRIERLAIRLEHALESYDTRIITQAVQSLALFSFAKQQPGDAPSLEFLRNFNPYEAMLAENGQQVSHPEWRALLSRYGFSSVDNFDRVILQGVESGHFNYQLLIAEANSLKDQLQRGDADERFTQAWRLYHGSFDDNADEVMEQLAKAVREVPTVITPANLSGTISLLKELRWGGNLADLIEGYVAAHSNRDREFWDLEASTFGYDVGDPDVQAAFNEKLLTFDEKVNFDQSLMALGLGGGWNRRDLACAAAQDEDRYFEAFKRLKGAELERALAGGLQFRSIANANPQMRAVTEMTEGALRRIAEESEINRRRVIQKGVTVDAIEEDTAH